MEKNKLMMIIIIVLLVLLLGLFVGFSFYTFSVLKNNPASEPGHITQSVITLAPDQRTSYKIGDPFKTNLLTGSDGKSHVISVSVSFGINKIDEKKATELLQVMTDSDASIRSDCLRVIRNQTYEDMNRADAMDLLAADILATTQERFNTNLIVDVDIYDIYIY